MKKFELFVKHLKHQSPEIPRLGTKSRPKPWIQSMLRMLGR
jgi:hypothetical protein